MPRLLETLILRNQPVPLEAWRGFWDRLDSGDPDRALALAVLTALSTVAPDVPTSHSLLDSLEERRESRGTKPAARWPGTVNAVGTGGGPTTLNLTTAACLVASAAGTPVVKTGSRGYTSRYGSFDILALLGVPLCGSLQECEEFLDRYGIAFAGDFVYPAEIARLARLTYPYDFRRTGRVFNVLGPFLADLPVATRITGVSDTTDLPRLTPLARRAGAPETWLIHNELGVDELVSFVPNTIDTGSGRPHRIGGDATPNLPYSAGVLADLAATSPGDDPAAGFRDLVSGRAPAPAVESVCLNAAAALLASGIASDWAAARRAAADAVGSGAATDLLQRLTHHRSVGTETAARHA